MRVNHGLDSWYRGYAPPPRRHAVKPDVQDTLQVEDIVQLTLDHDGVWRVVPSSSPQREVQADPQAMLRQASLLFPSPLRTYSPQGLASDLSQAKGQRLDTYV